jgi:GH24 family phage-related lysozyme (muramidase)
MIRPRLPIAALVLSAAGFAGIAINEHYTDTAVIPTRNDRPTVGLGSTFRDDGTPVQMGDTITPVKAIVRSIAHIQKDEAGLKRCVVAPMHQVEYDILVDFSYQYGVPTACRSSMVLYTNAGRYADACDAYTRYKFSGGYDCSTTINGQPNKRCWGVWKRSLERKERCLSVQ